MNLNFENLFQERFQADIIESYFEKLVEKSLPLWHSLQSPFFLRNKVCHFCDFMQK